MLLLQIANVAEEPLNNWLNEDIIKYSVYAIIALILYHVWIKIVNWLENNP